MIRFLLSKSFPAILPIISLNIFYTAKEILIDPLGLAYSI